MHDDKVKSDWWCVAIDETRHWNIAEEDRSYVDKIMGVYIFDRNTHTHCCELTPSYWLDFVDNAIFLKADTPEDVRERIHDRYNDPSDGCYMWVSAVEAIPDEWKKHYGTVDDTDLHDEPLTSEKQADVVREYYQGNAAF